MPFASGASLAPSQLTVDHVFASRMHMTIAYDARFVEAGVHGYVVVGECSVSCIGWVERVAYKTGVGCMGEWATGGTRI